MTIEEIQNALETSNCDCDLRGDRLFVNKTPNGTTSGWLVAGSDIRDITEHVSKRQGDVRQILRTACPTLRG